MPREPGDQTIFIEFDPKNRRAVRAYEKAGFQPVPRLAGRAKGVIIMHHVPPSEPRAE